MKKLALLLIPFILLLVGCTSESTVEKRETVFNSGWKFLREDAAGADQPGFDDSRWREVTLPHDYSIEDLPAREGVRQTGPFSEESAGGISTGHVVGGTAWYRKHFTLDKNDEGKVVKVLFDGIYMNSDVWINGHHLGRQPYGYSAFSFDLTSRLRPAGEVNVLAVQVKNEGKNSRWYSGSGIYRNVSLIKTHPVHIDLWGVFIRTLAVSEEMATLGVDVTLVNSTGEEQDVTLEMEFLDPDGNAVTGFSDAKELEASGNRMFAHEFELPDYRLWSVDKPELYTLVVRLREGEEIIDEVSEPFGIRTIDFSAEKGFLLNGEPVLLKGGCLHHDNGILGAAAFDRAEFRKIEIMKENGFNAVRTAHNPPSKALLDACDQLGMLVMDESFDHWQKPKNPQDYHLYFDEWWEKDMEAMVLRDRNHPSVIIWSIGNEIKERADSSGLAIAEKLRSKILEMDDTRPVTQAVCSFWDNPGKEWKDTEPVFALLDVHGYNYQWQKYEDDHKAFPERIMVGTESIAGEAYENWSLVEKHPYIIGDFVWTGMDYLGESGIGSFKLDNDTTSFLPPWPWFNAWCGDISILGYKKPQMYYRDVIWRNSELEMLVHAPVPEGRKEIVSFWGWHNHWKSWNWKGNEGTPLQVTVYSRCDSVRLELNGREVGLKPVSDATKLAAVFEVPYEAGELTAVGIKDGKEVVSQVLKTAGAPARILITPEQESVSASISDLAWFNVEIVDENGWIVPDAAVPVEFNIGGVGTLQAVGNDNPTDMKSFQQPRVNTYRGRCQLIVRSSEEPGEITVTVVSDGLESGEARVNVARL